MTDSDLEQNHVTLNFPANAAMWSLARIGVSTVAAQLDFDIEQVEDLRLAVTELCSTCGRDATPPSRVDLTCSWDSQALVVTCSVDQLGERSSEPWGAPEEDWETLSLRILDALVNEHHIDAVEGNRRTGWFRAKRELAL